MKTIESIFNELEIIDEPSNDCGCDGSGVIPVEINGQRFAKRCECFLEKIRKHNYEILQKLSRHDIHKKTEKPTTQGEAIRAIQDNKNLWMYGKTGQGKSFLAAKAIKNNIEQSCKKWQWLESYDIVNLWLSLYGDDKRSAAQDLEKTYSVEYLVLNDIDKIGKKGDKLTQEREAQFFRLIDQRVKRVTIITSQFSIVDFCAMMPDESDVKKRDGIGPIERRLKENFVEVCL